MFTSPWHMTTLGHDQRIVYPLVGCMVLTTVAYRDNVHPFVTRKSESITVRCYNVARSTTSTTRWESPQDGVPHPVRHQGDYMLIEAPPDQQQPSPPTGPAQADPARGGLVPAVDAIRRNAWVIGLGLWAAAGIVFGVHASGAALPDPTRFAMLDSWLIGLGCLGCPLLPLRALARRYNLQAFILVAVFCAALAIMQTALILSGLLHYNTLDATFALILPLAAAIQPFNAADAELHARSREAVAYRLGRQDGTAGLIDLHHAALAGMDRLEGMSPAELDAHIEIAQRILAAKLSTHAPLRLVAQPRGIPRPSSRPVSGSSIEA